MTEDSDFHEDLLSTEDYKDPNFRWTVKKQKFVYHMARQGLATKAAKLAGYRDEAYARSLLQYPVVRRAIQLEIRRLLHSSSESEESVIARWSLWANADVGDFFNPTWQLKDVTELSEEQRKCIKKVKITVNQWGRNIDLELHDAAKANADLANMMGLLGNAQDPAGTQPEETAKSIQQMLREIQETDAQEPPLESGGGTAGKVTH